MATKKKLPRPSHVDVSTDEYSRFTAGRKTTRSSMTSGSSHTPRMEKGPHIPWKPKPLPGDATLIKRKYKI